jgi:hypothetical protein
LYYQFNEGAGDAVNHGSLGSAYNATYEGSPTRQAATDGGDTGVQFDEAADFLESLTAVPTALTGNPTFTAEARVFIPTGMHAQNWAPMLHWGSTDTMTAAYFSFTRSDANDVFVGFYNGGLYGDDVLTDGEWHHIVWVRQGGGTVLEGTTLYVNGVSVSLSPDPELSNNTSNNTPNIVPSTFRVNNGVDSDRYFTGLLDEVALYDRALSEEEILGHFNEIPEPSTYALCLLTVACFVCARRRRRALKAATWVSG